MADIIDPRLPSVRHHQGQGDCPGETARTSCPGGSQKPVLGFGNLRCLLQRPVMVSATYFKFTDRRLCSVFYRQPVFSYSHIRRN